MKNIVILSSAVFGDKANANGLCASALADEFIANGDNVDIICYQTTGEYNKKATIHEIKNYEFRQKNTPKSRFFSKIYGLWSVLKHLVFPPEYNRKNESAFCDECEKILKQKHIDIIIAMYFPLETAFVLKRLKKSFPDIPMILYELDKALAIES